MLEIHSAMVIEITEYHPVSQIHSQLTGLLCSLPQALSQVLTFITVISSSICDLLVLEVFFLFSGNFLIFMQYFTVLFFIFVLFSYCKLHLCCNSPCISGAVVLFLNLIWAVKKFFSIIPINKEPIHLKLIEFKTYFLFDNSQNYLALTVSDLFCSKCI